MSTSHKKLIEIADEKTETLLKRCYGGDIEEPRSIAKRRDAVLRAFELGDMDVSEMIQINGR